MWLKGNSIHDYMIDAWCMVHGIFIPFASSSFENILKLLTCLFFIKSLTSRHLYSTKQMNNKSQLSNTIVLLITNNSTGTW